MRNTKTLWSSLSQTKPYRLILSVLIHMAILSIPVSVVVRPQIHEMELFISIEDVQVPPEHVKKRVVIKKPQAQPQPEPVKEMIEPIEPSYPEIQNPEIVEPINEVEKKPTLDTQEEPIKETFFTPSKSSIREKNNHLSGEVGIIGGKSDVEKQALVSHHVAKDDTETPIETRFGASVAPAFLHREMPVYPMMARKLGGEGRVVLKLTIDEKGNLLDVEVIEWAGYGFTEAAVEAVKKSTFLPAKRDGKPIASRALLPIRFQLERN